MYNDQRLTGGGANRSVKSLGGMAMLRYSGKKWTAEAMYNLPFKSISDIGVSKGENYGYFEFSRMIGKTSASEPECATRSTIGKSVRRPRPDRS